MPYSNNSLLTSQYCTLTIYLDICDIDIGFHLDVPTQCIDICEINYISNIYIPFSIYLFNIHCFQNKLYFLIFMVIIKIFHFGCLDIYEINLDASIFVVTAITLLIDMTAAVALHV